MEIAAVPSGGDRQREIVEADPRLLYDGLVIAAELPVELDEAKARVGGDVEGVRLRPARGKVSAEIARVLATARPLPAKPNSP